MWYTEQSSVAALLLTQKPGPYPMCSMPNPDLPYNTSLIQDVMARLIEGAKQG